MKKILLFSMLILLLGACTSTPDADRMSRSNEAEWWEEAGEPGTENWWINSYDDSGDSE